MGSVHSPSCCAWITVHTEVSTRKLSLKQQTSTENRDHVWLVHNPAARVVVGMTIPEEHSKSRPAQSRASIGDDEQRETFPIFSETCCGTLALVSTAAS
jgi:hypothetical protein